MLKASGAQDHGLFVSDVHGSGKPLLLRGWELKLLIRHNMGLPGGKAFVMVLRARTIGGFEKDAVVIKIIVLPWDVRAWVMYGVMVLVENLQGLPSLSASVSSSSGMSNVRQRFGPAPWATGPGLSALPFLLPEAPW